jgi:SAM-dependent methyltransferase
MTEIADPYSTHAAVYTKFYQLTLDSGSVSEFIRAKSEARLGQRALFVGGMFELAAGLLSSGIAVTVVDYTDEMVELAKRRLPNCPCQRADLRNLPFDSEFDLVFVVGRVFTHMITDGDLLAALDSCRRSLKPGGRLLADNYEDTRIQKTHYFNSTIKVADKDSEISRVSTTEFVSSSPFCVTVRASYSGNLHGQDFEFDDVIAHRAFGRTEFARHLSDGKLRVIDQGDNFDETSFYTVALRES